ncbi:MAG: hypothetical protein GX573_21735 [Chloroflexi bacterium]|nr:hypothetical protein [Chloroflexota bacterium]
MIRVGVISLLLLSGCTLVGTHRPSEADWAWLCETGMTNDPAMVYAYSPVEFITLGQAELNDAIPTSNGAVITRRATCDNTGFLTAFKWMADTAADAAREAWSGARAVPQPDGIRILQREQELLR